MRAWRSLSVGRRVALLLALLLTLLTLAMLLNRVARQAIAVPLAYAGWIANQLFKSVPQMVIWGWLLLMVVTLALLALRRSKTATQNYDTGARRQKQERIAFWAMQVSMARRGEYYRTRFSEFFSKIIWGVLSYRRGGSAAGIERAFRAGQVEMPAPLRSFILARANPGGEDPPKGCLAALFAPFRRARATLSPAERDRELERAVAYLEQQLEVKHERRH